MYSYAAKLSWICAMTLAFWFLMKDQTNADNVVAVWFFMAELGLLTVYLTYRAIRRFARWVMFRATCDVKYWNGPTLTFEGSDKKFLPILDVVGTMSQSRRDKYAETLSDEDAEMYWTTYMEAVRRFNAEQKAEYDDWVASGGPEREAAYEANYRAEKAEKRAVKAAGFAAAAAAREAHRQESNARFASNSAAARKNLATSYQPKPYTPPKQPEKYRVQEMRPGMSSYSNRTGGTDLLNAQKQLEGAKNQRRNISGADKIKYRIVDKNGRVQ